MDSIDEQGFRANVGIILTDGGGRVLIADLVGSDDEGARALQNEIERLRDPAHIELQSLRGIEALFTSHGLAYDEDRSLPARAMIWLMTWFTFFLSLP